MKPPGKRREWKRLFGLCALLYIALIASLAIRQRAYIYLPDNHTPNRAQYGALDMDVVTVTLADGSKIAGWYKAPSPGRPVIIVFHGNAANIGIYSPKAHQFMAAGYGVLLAEYGGYGGNPGQPGEQNFYADARAWLGWLGQQGIASDRVVLLGQSIGTGVAVQMAVEHPQALALVLESPFTSLGEIVQRQIWYTYTAPFLRDRFDNIGKIKKVRMPVYIIHGQKDTVVPYSEGLALYQAANKPKMMETIPTAGHFDLARYGDADRILSFLNSLKTR